MEDDVIKLNVALFLRLLELAKEDAKTDVELHKITEIVTSLSQEKVLTIDDYEEILDYSQISKNNQDELESIKRLSGVNG